MIWFSADHHFDHKNIIKYCKRPFSGVGEMEVELFKRHNKVVKEDDTVYFIGDFTLKREGMRYSLQNIVTKLNGNIHLILGNHDRNDPFFYHEIGFKSVHTILEVEEFTLVHDPAIANMNSSKPFLVGHIHNIFKKSKNALNVGVDVWDFYPISIDQVRKEFKQ